MSRLLELRLKSMTLVSTQVAKLTLSLCRNLQLALELYRKAEAYVPDNIKLKERWILFVVHVFIHMAFNEK